MEKRRKSITILIILGLIVMIAYWFVIHPKSYSYYTAEKNGDVVMGADGRANIEKFHAFIKNVETKQTDKIRITGYSKKGITNT